MLSLHFTTVSVIITFFSVIINLQAKDVVHVSITDNAVSFPHESLSQLQHIAVGGFTPSYKPNGKMLTALKNYGFRSMRLINVEWDNAADVVNGKIVDMEWSRKLERELKTCKQQGFIPHIIVGQIVPHGLQVSGDGNARRGVKDWNLYRQYLNLLMNHVTNYWGLKNVVWEIGNEMDNPKFNWVPVKPVSTRMSDRAYINYMQLYRFIAETIDDYRKANPDLTMLVGGPALTQYSMLFSPESSKNWLVRFARDISEKKIVCDFFSMHFYGSAGTREDLKNRVDYIKAVTAGRGNTLPIWVTEWGASAFFQHKNENFLPNAGSFSLDFLRTAVDAGITNTLFIAIARHTDEKKSGPALLNRDGTKSYAFIGIDMIMSLRGNRLQCQSDTAGVACIAAKKGNNVEVLLWHSDWASRALGNRKWLSLYRNQEIEANVSINGLHVGVIPLQTNNYASRSYP